jgi:hypothetical protein
VTGEPEVSASSAVEDQALEQLRQRVGNACYIGREADSWVAVSRDTQRRTLRRRTPAGLEPAIRVGGTP